MEDNKDNPVPQTLRHQQANYWFSWMRSGKKMYEPTAEDIKCELQLQALSDFEPLMFEIDYDLFRQEITQYEDRWISYLPREGIINNRQGLCLVGLENDLPTDSSSLPEARRRTGNKTLNELDFNVPTQLYKDLTCLHKILGYWSPIGRTMLVKTNAGGWFPPHKDHPLLTRDCFRVIAFIGSAVDHEAYEWEMNGRTWPIKQNRSYYVDTRKTHRTHSWQENSIHLIMNIPKTWENVLKLMAATKDF